MDVPQIMEEVVDVIETVSKENISERILEQFVEAFDEPVPQEENVEVIQLSSPSGATFGDRFSTLQDDPLVMQMLHAAAPEAKSQRDVQIPLTTHRIVAVNGTSSIRLSPMTERNGRLSPMTERNGQLRRLGVCRMAVPRWISRKCETASRPVLRWKCGLFHRNESRSVHRSSMCQCLSISQVTKHAELPQSLFIDTVVLPVVMQRQVPQIHGELMTVKAPTAQFIDRVVEAPLMKQLRQCRLSRRTTRSKSASRSVH